jgi:hypothetical protein
VRAYEVGKPYSATRTHWPEGGEYHYRQDAHKLRLFYRRPSPAEVTAVRSGEASFALFIAPPVLVFCYKFGSPGRGIPWSNAPYSAHLVRAVETLDPPPVETLGPESRALLFVHLIDAETGILLAKRQVRFSPQFTRALHGAIADQLAVPWDPAAYDAARLTLYARYSTSEAFAASAHASCLGGS